MICWAECDRIEGKVDTIKEILKSKRTTS